MSRTLNKLYYFFEKRVFPKISNIRGSYRLKVALQKFIQLGIPKVEDEPESAYELSWDNLLILDACRHDLYEELKGQAESRVTLASNSASYIAQNFSEGNFSDIVYVTGNPFFSEGHFKDLTGRNPEDVFHDVFHTYMTDWDKKNQTVLPEPLIRDAKTAKKLYPDKRVVVHFMQPHHPFLNADFEESGADPNKSRENKIWKKAFRGEYNEQEVWEEYKENLKYILSEIEIFSKNIDGKTVITADHGNLVGENGLFGHGLNSETKALRKVPWDVVGQ